MKYINRDYIANNKFLSENVEDVSRSKRFIYSLSSRRNTSRVCDIINVYSYCIDTLLNPLNIILLRILYLLSKAFRFYFTTFSSLSILFDYI